MKSVILITLVGVSIATPCFAQPFGVGPALSKEEIIALAERAKPAMDLLEHYQKQLDELQKCRVGREAKRAQDDQEKHRDPQATGNH